MHLYTFQWISNVWVLCGTEHFIKNSCLEACDFFNAGSPNTAWARRTNTSIKKAVTFRAQSHAKQIRNAFFVLHNSLVTLRAKLVHKQRVSIFTEYGIKSTVGIVRQQFLDWFLGCLTTLYQQLRLISLKDRVISVWWNVKYWEVNISDLV
jgi:hypothetical protein